MIVGIGMDLVEVRRFEAALDRHGERLLRRLFTDAERQYCESRPSPTASLAARFAAREAFLKALGTGLAAGIRWTEIEVVRLEGGGPGFRLSGAAAGHFARLGATVAWLTLTHTDSTAAATVVIER